MAGHKLRLKRIQNDLCGNCGKPRGSKGTKTMCRDCADEHSSKQSKSNARTRDEREEAGLCLDCGEERFDRHGKLRPAREKLCSVCQGKRKDRYKRYYKGLRPKPSQHT